MTGDRDASKTPAAGYPSVEEWLAALRDTPERAPYVPRFRRVAVALHRRYWRGSIQEHVRTDAPLRHVTQRYGSYGTTVDNSLDNPWISPEAARLLDTGWIWNGQHWEHPGHGVLFGIGDVAAASGAASRTPESAALRWRYGYDCE